MRPDFSSVLAVEGASGTGKTSLLRGLAERYGCEALEIGVVVRAIAWWASRNRISVPDAVASIAKLSNDGRVQVLLGQSNALAAVTMALDGLPLGNEAFHPSLSSAISAAAIDAESMAWVHSLARERVRGRVAAISGREIVERTCPGAGLAVRLVAQPQIRRARKNRQLARVGLPPNWTDDISLINDPVPGTVLIDTTAVSPATVLGTVAGLAEGRLGWKRLAVSVEPNHERPPLVGQSSRAAGVHTMVAPSLGSGREVNSVAMPEGYDV